MKTIGIITKTYGFEGAVIIRPESVIARVPENGEPVFIMIDAIPVPFFTREAYSPSPDTLVIAFDDYETEASVLRFRGCEVKYSEKDNNGEDDPDLTGYTITDQESGFKGIITSVVINPGQILAEVLSSESTVLIPLHPDLIKKINHREKTIIMSLPLGLTGIND